MGTHISGKLIDAKSTELRHGPSGAIIRTTAPVDNGGVGTQFSPTDLCAASLGACVMTIIGLYAEKHKIPLKGLNFELEKEMTTTAPRRISKLIASFILQTDCSEEDFKRLVRAGQTCPVRHSLLEDIDVRENYVRA